MTYDKMGAIELQREIDNAEYRGTELSNALKEVARLRSICQEVVEIINTDHRLMIEPIDYLSVFHHIEEVAQGYFRP